MNKNFQLLTAAMVALTVSGCGSSDSQNNVSEPASDMSAAESPRDDINLKSEFEYQQKMGNSVEGKSDSPDLFKKELGTSIGSTITIPGFFLWSKDSSEWEKGGKLIVTNDDSMGSQFRIACALSPDQGDKIMKDLTRREIDITGTISSYSSSNGLLIDPCNVTRDELDSPKKETATEENIEGSEDGSSDQNQ